MMYIITVSMDIAPGKTAEALKHLEKMVAHRKAATGKDTRILKRVVGVQGHVVLAASYDSLAAWEEARAANAVDAEWQTILSNAIRDGLFTGPSDVVLWTS